MSQDPERLDVPVDGGALAAYRWPGDGPVVLAAHGITSNHRSWALVAAALEGAATLVAPDLRGRGRSNDLPGPYTVAQHADDCAAVLDHVGADAAVVTGHSMGGFVATALATRHPERVRAVVLVDGGPPLNVPPGVDVDDALAATLGPAMQRLDMTFGDRGAYRAFWQQHPSFAGIWSGDVDAHVQHDLIGEEPHMRSSCVKEAVRVNGRELLVDETVRGAVHGVACPLVLLWAPRGMVDNPGGLYDEERLGGIEHECVPDTNHYSILLGARGAGRVAAAIRRAL
ncbi:MAG TPA: alpha/beta hydrolase [Solirubrobacteraceae bacterium]|nr:alpha/beta hydrolase [Solirubrobacteraceae bacterium]